MIPVEQSMERNLEGFVNQAMNTTDLAFWRYINYYKGLNVKTSFGQGGQARIPWISMRGEGQTTSNGLYVSILLFKSQKVLAVIRGVSEENKPLLSWPNSGELETVKDYFKKNGYTKPDRYGSSYVFSIHKLEDIDYRKFVRDIDKLIAEYKLLLKSNNLPEDAKFVAPDVRGKGAKREYYDDSISSEDNFLKKVSNPTLNISIEDIKKSIFASGLIYSESLIHRLYYALEAKPFVILSGLAGSGKTQLAIQFAKAMTGGAEDQTCLVAVGADWTNREPLLGYPDALNQDHYVMPESGVLQLILEATRPENAEKKYYLIFDEMNMSVVERYFADFLSEMEAHKGIKLCSNERKDDNGGKVPTSVILPENVYIIGTINVDETTYMFSPKVLDRATVIEFKIAESEMENFLDKKYPENKDVLLGFFRELKKVNAEFGYRSATEIARYIENYVKGLGKDKLDEAVDTAILQKLLPKLHGSKKKLTPVLEELWKLCHKGASSDLAGLKEYDDSNLKYPESAEKIYRMYRAVTDNGFTSFAEA